MRDPDFTISAGPTAASPRTLAAMGSPIVYHYDPVFLQRFRDTQAKAAELFRTTNDVLLLQGEAILGLEAGGRATVRPGMHVLNLVQGVFGKGHGFWLRDWGAELHELEVPYNDQVDPAEVEAYLERHPQIEQVCWVHVETPSGTVSRTEELGRIVREHGAVSYVDCVAGVGGTAFEVDAWDLDICVAGAQKCLAGPPGITLMTVSERGWRQVEANPAAPRSSYLSILDWREKWLGEGRFPFTPSVSDIYGVESVLDQVLEEGVDEAIARHALVARATRAGAQEMGLELWPRSEAMAANSVTSITVPEGLTDLQVRDHARERYGVMLSHGQGAGNVIRIGHMGVTARPMYAVVGLAAIGRTLADLGAPVRTGAGIEATLEVFAAAGVVAGA